jgi:hypothetical protein
MVHRNAKAPKSRARLIEIKGKLGRKGAPDEEIIDTFLEKYPEIARVENGPLIRIALKSILNVICNFNAKPEDAQLDLFQGYRLPLTVSVPAHNGKNAGRKVKKNFDAMTKAEVREYIARRTDPAPKQSRRTLEVIRFYNENARDYGDDSSTMMQCWKAASLSTYG